MIVKINHSPIDFVILKVPIQAGVFGVSYKFHLCANARSGEKELTKDMFARPTLFSKKISAINVLFEKRILCLIKSTKQANDWHAFQIP